MGVFILYKNKLDYSKQFIVKNVFFLNLKQSVQNSIKLKKRLIYIEGDEKQFLG